MERFLHPDEDDVTQIRRYFQAAFTSQVSARRTAFLYVIAVHHVNRFVYTQDGRHARLKSAMLRQLLQTNSVSANPRRYVCPVTPGTFLALVSSSFAGVRLARCPLQALRSRSQVRTGVVRGAARHPPKVRRRRQLCAAVTSRARYDRVVKFTVTFNIAL